MVHKGPYSGDRMMRPYFLKLKKWINEEGLKSGVWIFRTLSEDEAEEDEMIFEASIEIIGSKRKLVPPKDVRIQEIVAGPVACVKFDPTLIADRVIYHGLESWLEWRKKCGEYERNGPDREVYQDDPWSSSKAWKHLEIQVPVKKL